MVFPVEFRFNTNMLRSSSLVVNAGLIAALLVASVFLFYSGPEAFSIRSLRELWNLGHIVYFGLLVYLLSRPVFGHRLSRKHIWLVAILVTLVWGLSIEVLQYFWGRSASWMDLSLDFCGTLLALGFLPGLMNPLTGKLNAIVRICIVGFTLFHLSPFVLALSDEQIARNQFPVLSDFETPFELDRWTGDAGMSVVSSFAGKPGHQLKIDLGTQRYSGVGMNYLPSEWRSYNNLNLEIYYPYQQPLSITIRVHDVIHQTVQPRNLFSDRYNRQYQLESGWNQIEIELGDIEQAPNSRKMDMSQIVDVSFFASRLERPLTIYLDRIYLSNRVNK